MCGHSNLMKRDGTYYARRATPKEVLDARVGAGQKAGPYERVKSLRTKDKAEAKRLLRVVLDEFDADWERELRALTQSPEPVPAGKHLPTEAELKSALADLVARYRDNVRRGVAREGRRAGDALNPLIDNRCAAMPTTHRRQPRKNFMCARQRCATGSGGALLAP